MKPCGDIVPNAAAIKRAALLLCLGIFFINAPAQQTREPVNFLSGEVFETVDNLIVSGPFHIYLSQSDEPSMVIKGRQQDLKSFRSYLKNGNLTLYCNQEIVDGRIDVFLSLPGIKSISATGPVEIETPTNIVLSTLSLDLDEESEMVLFVNSTDFSLNLAGSGRILLAGIIDTLRTSIYNEIDAEMTVHSKKVFCKLKDESSLVLDGEVFYLDLQAGNESFADAWACQVGTCFAVSKGNANVKISCLDRLEMMAVENSNISYRNSKKAEVLVMTEKARISDGH